MEGSLCDGPDDFIEENREGQSRWANSRNSPTGAYTDTSQITRIHQPGTFTERGILCEIWRNYGSALGHLLRAALTGSFDLKFLKRRNG